MNVLIIENSKIGGHAHYASLLINNLKKLRCNVSVLSKEKDTEFESLVEVPYHTGSLKKLLKKEKIDVVHFFQSYSFYKSIPFLLLNRLNKKVKTVYTIHNFHLHEKGSIRGFIFFRLQNIVLKLVDHVIVHSNYIKKKVTKIIPGKKVSVIYHGNYGWFDNNKYNRTSARKKLNIKKNSFVIVFFGSVRKYKGIPYLIDAVKDMKDTTVLIAGKVWKDMKKYMEKVKKYDFVRTYDGLIPNEDVELYYKAADVAVCPYLRITTSGVLTVAMGLKTPIITTNVDSTPEIVGDSAILVPNKDSNAIKTALLKLKNNPKLRKGLAEKAYKKATTKFSWSASAKKTFNMYKKLIS